MNLYDIKNYYNEVLSKMKEIDSMCSENIFQYDNVSIKRFESKIGEIISLIDIVIEKSMSKNEIEPFNDKDINKKLKKLADYIYVKGFGVLQFLRNEGMLDVINDEKFSWMFFGSSRIGGMYIIIYNFEKNGEEIIKETKTEYEKRLFSKESVAQKLSSRRRI